MKETERPTPETESSICRYACPGWPDGRPLTFDDEPTVPADFARRLERERDRARRELIEAGWTHVEGAPRWKPPVNREMGELWNRLIETERERDELRAELDEIKDYLWPNQAGLPNAHRNALIAIKRREELLGRSRDELRDALSGMVEYGKRFFPEKGHEGPCGSWAACDGLCAEVHYASELLSKSENALANTAPKGEHE